MAMTLPCMQPSVRMQSTRLLRGSPFAGAWDFVRTKSRHHGRLRLSRYKIGPMFGMKQIADYAKAVYVVEIGYFFCIFLIKVSLLCLYLRIASPGTRFRKATIITMATIVLQITSTVVVEAIQCIPMKKYWDRTVPGHCIDITVFFYCNTI